MDKFFEFDTTFFEDAIMPNDSDVFCRLNAPIKVSLITLWFLFCLFVLGLSLLDNKTFL
jgi:hypothetical protein